LRVILPWMIGRAFEKVGERLGPLVQGVLKQMFPKYNLTAKTWTSLTKSQPHTTGGAPPERYRSESVYQILVPMAAVAFAFFLVLNVGWLFTAERRQGTLRRLQAAPLSRTEILLGKFLPCLGISVAQGLLLLGAGKVIFGMNWGPQPLWLLPVVFTTSLAAMGLALLVASVARTETQVAIFGTLLVLGMALMGGCLIPRALMPEEIQPYTYLTPHAWALDAYTELVSGTRNPNYLTVVESCGVLVAFGAGFVALAWWFLKLDG
jgi:ABC-type multidrug transport system permease subunit